MYSSFAMRCTNNFSRSLIDYNLRLKGMLFLLAAIKSFLFFLGRSIGLSVTSMTTVLITDYD
jgi:hypothetical protein